MCRLVSISLLHVYFVSLWQDVDGEGTDCNNQIEVNTERNIQYIVARQNGKRSAAPGQKATATQLRVYCPAHKYQLTRSLFFHGLHTHTHTTRVVIEHKRENRRQCNVVFHQHMVLLLTCYILIILTAAAI